MNSQRKNNASSLISVATICIIVVLAACCVLAEEYDTRQKTVKVVYPSEQQKVLIRKHDVRNIFYLKNIN